MKRTLFALVLVLAATTSIVRGEVRAEVDASGGVSVRPKALKDIPAADFLASRGTCSTEGTKAFAGETLCYVTPWNRGGYAATLKHVKKLDWVSPVWYALSGAEGAAIGRIEWRIKGGHDVDRAWLAKLRQAAAPPRVVPRVAFDPEGSVLGRLLSDSAAQRDIIVALLALAGTPRQPEASGQGEDLWFDGLTMEMPGLWEVRSLGACLLFPSVCVSSR